MSFVITELPADGAVIPGGPARFDWHADEPGKPGRRAAPRRPFTMGTSVRHKRTDYAGSDEPTHQIFGPSAKPMTFEGEWLDKWNSPGYARATRRAFNDLVRRGNLVRVEFLGMAWVGLITDADYPYDYDERIAYRFTLDPQREEDAAPLVPTTGSVTGPLSASALTDDLITEWEELGELAADPPPLAGSFLDDFNEAMSSIEGAIAEIDATVNARIVQPAEETRLALARLGQLFGQIRSASFDAATTLLGWRSDLQLAWQSAETLLRFEEWMRLTSAQLRLVGLGAYRSQDQVIRRADPEAKATYRPREGEHLMAISQQFYGGPNQWRGIMLRNGLSTPTMTGDEILVIPSTGRDA